MSSKGIAGFNSGLAKSTGNSYTPTEWETGDVITAEKLNHMEDGIADSGSSKSIVPTFTFTAEGTTCDMEFDEILHAVENGTCDHARGISTSGPSDNYDVFHLNHYDTYSPTKTITFTFITWSYNTQNSSIVSLQCTMLHLRKTRDNVEISMDTASHTF